MAINMRKIIGQLLKNGEKEKEIFQWFYRREVRDGMLELMEDMIGLSMRLKIS